LNGARLLLVPQSAVLDAGRFSGLLARERVTLLWMTAGLFTQYVDALGSVFNELQYLMVGGDVVDPGAVGRVLREKRPNNFLNCYGPTECTTFSTTHLIEKIDDDTVSVPIGRPISNARIYILDGRLQPLAIGVSGEVYIGGAGVAREYLNRPELTA